MILSTILINSACQPRKIFEIRLGDVTGVGLSEGVGVVKMSARLPTLGVGVGEASVGVRLGRGVAVEVGRGVGEGDFLKRLVIACVRGLEVGVGVVVGEGEGVGVVVAAGELLSVELHLILFTSTGSLLTPSLIETNLQV